VLEGHSQPSSIYLFDFREDRADEAFDPARNMRAVLFSKLLKRLMREIEEIAIVPNCTENR
ncbi:MAG TPA: hypothetical protein VF772_26010, partial [Terriglobales bacterium]